jgi:hypothetical protein
MMIFSAQRAWNLPRYTHTFATFVKVAGGQESRQNRPDFGPDSSEHNGIFQTNTISWLAAKKKVCLFRLWPEPGANLDLTTSLEWALSVQSRISMWGPFQIQSPLYEKALAQKARLESGRIQYKVVDNGFRPQIASSCIHGVCDIDRERGPLWTWFRYGESASRCVAVFFLPWVIDPHQNHRWISDHLGLTKYPIIYRQLSAPVLGSASGGATSKPMVQAQAS